MHVLTVPNALPRIPQHSRACLLCDAHERRRLHILHTRTHARSPAPPATPRRRPASDEVMIETFTGFLALREITFQFLEQTRLWQKGFTKLRRPRLLERDYMLDMIEEIDFVNTTSLRRPYNFQVIIFLPCFGLSDSVFFQFISTHTHTHTSFFLHYSLITTQYSYTILGSPCIISGGERQPFYFADPQS